MMLNNTDNPNGIALDCGIAFSRIRHWLDDELSLPREPSVGENATAWRYVESGSVCRIEASPLNEGRIGPLSLERTYLTAQGDAEALASFQRRFTLRFMSAGG